MLLSGQARAASSAELVACFSALSGPGEDNRPISAGRGQDISNWEWAPPKAYTSIAVAERRGGREGFYLYGDGGRAEYYHFDTPKIPREERTGTYRVILLEIRPQGDGRDLVSTAPISSSTRRASSTAMSPIASDELLPTPAQVGSKESEADWSALKGAVMDTS